MTKFFLYLGRWQLSSPILFGAIVLLPSLGITDSMVQTIIANLLGGVIFYWVDKKIFQSKGKVNG